MGRDRLRRAGTRSQVFTPYNPDYFILRAFSITERLLEKSFLPIYLVTGSSRWANRP